MSAPHLTELHQAAGLGGGGIHAELYLLKFSGWKKYLFW